MSARKPAHRRQRGARTKGLELVGGGVANPPDPPDGLLKATRLQWVAFWKTDVAELVVIGTDLPALERLFWLYDERRRAVAAVRKNRMVEGSKGQPVENPLGRAIDRYDSSIQKLEDRFGMSAKGRLNLGIAGGSGPNTLADLNRMLEDDDDGDEVQDPRIKAI